MGTGSAWMDEPRELARSAHTAPGNAGSRASGRTCDGGRVLECDASARQCRQLRYSDMAFDDVPASERLRQHGLAGPLTPVDAAADVGADDAPLLKCDFGARRAASTTRRTTTGRATRGNAVVGHGSEQRPHERLGLLHVHRGDASTGRITTTLARSRSRRRPSTSAWARCASTTTCTATTLRTTATTTAWARCSSRRTTDGVSWTTIWTKSGDQGNSWQRATVSITTPNVIRVRWVGTTVVRLQLQRHGDRRRDHRARRLLPARTSRFRRYAADLPTRVRRLPTDDAAARRRQLGASTSGDDDFDITRALSTSRPTPERDHTSGTCYFCTSTCGFDYTTDYDWTRLSTKMLRCDRTEQRPHERARATTCHRLAQLPNTARSRSRRRPSPSAWARCASTTTCTDYSSITWAR